MKVSEIILPMVSRAMKTHGVVGAGISIIDGDGPVFTGHCGFADKTGKRPVGPSTVFRIGSVTKVFTASAIMQLAERGAIDLDKPIREYLPGFSIKSRFPQSAPITVRSILCHHSGLPCDNLAGYFADDPEAFHSVVPYLTNAYTVCRPGEMFYYSNLGYELLGVLISRISGMPFHRYIDTVLLRDLRMSDSGVELAPGMKNNLSRPYRRGREQVERMMKCVPEGGIHSTAGDMALFMSAMVNGGKGLFRSEKTLLSMLEPQFPGNPRDLNMNNGLGWFIGKPGLDHAGKVIWHDGGTPNFFSLVVIVPERKLGITLLTNSSTGAMMNHCLSTEILQLLLRENHGIRAPVLQNDPAAALSSDQMRKKTGGFFTLAGIADVAVSGRYLVARLPSGTFRMRPCKDGWFGVVLLLFGILPLKIKKLSMLRIGIFEINGEKAFALEQLGLRSLQGREKRKLNTSKAWEERCGDYRCIQEKEPRLKAFRLQSTRDGLSIASATDKMGRMNLFLDVIDDTEALTVGFGRYTGETVFASGSVITLFGLEFQKIRAKKVVS